MEPFYTKDGKEVKTLSEMADALEVMTEEDYSHHVSPQRNDVSLWVQHVHKNDGLAKALGQAKDKETMITLLKEVGQASFPEQEEYHPTQGVGKEDPELHDTYNKKEEWDAAKDAHPEEEVENPATGEVSKGNPLSDIADEYNTKSEENQPAESAEEKPEEAQAEPEKPDDMESKPVVDEVPEHNEATTIGNVVPEDVNPPAPGPLMKDKIIWLLIGLIVGLIIGYGLSLVI